jgi:hypothetical protein
LKVIPAITETIKNEGGELNTETGEDSVGNGNNNDKPASRKSRSKPEKTNIEATSDEDEE